MEEQLIRLASKLQELAPHVWDIGIKQVDTMIAAKEMWHTIAIAIFIGMAIILIILWLVGIFAALNESYFGFIVVAVFITFLFVVIATIMYDSLWVQAEMMKLNPEFYAIDILKKMLLTR